MHAAKIAVCSHKMLRYLFPLNTLNVNRDNVNKNVENKSIREIQIPNAVMVKLRHKVEVKGLALEFNTLAANTGPGE